MCRYKSSRSGLFFLILLLLLGSCSEPETKAPNILWITVEDMSPRLAAYGDSTVSTPNIDRLASEGMLFENVFSISGLCSPSRSALITACYPTSIGTHHHRTSSPENPFCEPYLGVPPPEVKAFPEFLRAGGYYCTNNVKTDYQFGLPFTIWDESSPGAHWRRRSDPEQPFFAVFNTMRTHEGWVIREDQWIEMTDATDSLENPGFYQYALGMQEIDREKFTDPSAVSLPPYYPDHPDIRKDVARQYDNILKMDEWVEKS